MPFRMPFGKHKGQDISDVPAAALEHYLAWDQLRPDTRQAIDRELTRRRGGRPHPGGSEPVPEAVLATARELVDAGQVALAADAVGQAERQAVLERAAQLLRGWLRTAPRPDQDRPVPF
jgi:hypothetical protein